MFPLFPVIVFARIFPEPFILPSPVSVRFSTLGEAVKVADEYIRSVPADKSSVTLSWILST